MAIVQFLIQSIEHTHNDLILRVALMSDLTS
jgi:hypothetical protein